MDPLKSVKDLEKLTGVEITGFVDDILPYYQSDYFIAPFRIPRGFQNKVFLRTDSTLYT